MDLATPKTFLIDAYLILYSELTYTRLVKVNNQNAKITGFLASNVIKLSSIYTGCYLVSGLSLFI